MAHILLIEDNEMNWDMLSARLRREGYTVSIATDGLQGITRAKSTFPDLILMDLSLPVIDGWNATRQLRQDATTCTIPIIALTAHAIVGDREKAIEAGCNDYLTKPIDFSALKYKMATLLTAG
ncbi:MAG: response regulator [Chloroflexota bacterium]